MREATGKVCATTDEFCVGRLNHDSQDRAVLPGQFRFECFGGAALVMAASNSLSWLKSVVRHKSRQQGKAHCRATSRLQLRL